MRISYLCAALAVLLDCTPPARSPIVHPGLTAVPVTEAESLVGEAIRPPLSDWFFLPVTLQSRSFSVILDTGTGFNVFLFAPSVTELGLTFASTDTGTQHASTADGRRRLQLNAISIGSATEHHVPAVIGDFAGFDTSRTPSGSPPLVGILGNLWLPHYDLLFDGSADRVWLYRMTSSAQRTWLPKGLTPADCTPLLHDPDNGKNKSIFLDIVVDGHVIPSWFDSGSRQTVMNTAAAELLSSVQQRDSSRKLSLFNTFAIPIGSRRLTVTTFGARDDGDKPWIQFGNDVFENRLMFVSYSTQRVCFGAAVSQDTKGGK